MPVHLYVDVDGVINALAPAAASGWDHFDEVVVLGFRIRWSPDLVTRLNALAAREDTAMHWLTTWGDEAPRSLCPALGIDGTDWPVLGPVEHHVGGRAAPVVEEGPRARLETPGSTWWKLDAIRTHLPPGVPAVWLDDDLRHDDAALAWVAQRGDLLGIAPDLAAGLTRGECEEVERFVASVV